MKLGILFFCILFKLQAQIPVPGGVSGGGGSSGTTSYTLNKQTGTTYIILSTDCGAFIQHKQVSAIAYTIPDTTGSFSSGCLISILNLGSGLLTLSRTSTSTIIAGAGAGLTSTTISPMQFLVLLSDGTNWQVVHSSIGWDGNSTTWSLPTNSTMNVTGGAGNVNIGGNGLSSGGTVSGSGVSVSNTYKTSSNCTSAAAPAVCAANITGSVVIAAAATTVIVNTTAVTANSQIFLMYDSSLGTKLSVTCNTSEPALYGVTARTAATSFTITATSPITNPACFSYLIVN